MSLMSPVRGRTRALVAGVVLASVSAIAIAAAPAGAQTSSPSTPCPSGPPVLSVANPNPGDVLSQGDYIFSGAAFDPAASDGSGISHVDLFIGNRDDGGLLLASATPLSGRQYEVKGTVPANLTGSHDFYAYAVSSVTGQQTSVSFPIYLGAAPTPTPSSATAPTPVPLTENTQSSCSTGASAAAPAAAPAVSVPQPAAAAAISVSASGSPVLSLGNPSAGDMLPLGDVFIDGVAYDPSATQGAGVDRVELFLDSRESGGTVVGIGAPGSDRTFNIKVTLHSNQSGSHTFYAYARSSVTGQETVTSVPVFVGVSPTATPRPTNS